MGGANQNIVLTTKSDGPVLVGEMGVLDILEKPPGGKFGAENVHRASLVRPEERGLVTIMGTIGIFYANNVGTVGAAATEENWDRRCSAAHLRAMSLAGNGNFHCYFPDGSIVLSEYGISEQKIY